MEFLRNLLLLFETIGIVSAYTGLAALVIVEAALALLEWGSR